jgi:hypothetical protein
VEITFQQKRVWKLHFARQITVAEQQPLITFKSTHLEAAEMNEIAKLKEDIFDEHVLQKLSARLSSSFETYSPYKTVMDYLHQHSSSLQWDKKLDFRTPREKQSQVTRTSKHEKHKDRTPQDRMKRSEEHTGRTKERKDKHERASSLKRRKGSKPTTSTRRTIPDSGQCRRPKCRERGNNLNHSIDSCRFKDASTRHPNLGRAPEKRVKHASPSLGGKNRTQAYKPKTTAPQAASGATPTGKRLYYICASEDRISSSCPQKEQNKTRARKTLTKIKNFMALRDEKSESKEEKLCATRMLEARDDENL